MVDPYFRLNVSVYYINKIIHRRLEIWNLPSRVQFELPPVATSLKDKFHIFARSCIILYKSEIKCKDVAGVSIDTSDLR